MDLIKKENIAIASIKVAERFLSTYDTLEVVFKDLQYFCQKDVSAIFIKEGYYIVFNNFFLENSSLIEIMITGFHEARHAYQYMQVEFFNKKMYKCIREELYIINKWEKDFNRGRKINEMSREEYLNRPTEIDAIAFSCYLADELLNVKQVIPDEIKEKVNVRIKEIKKTIII